MKMLGMPLGIPPELDLPAGAPFEGRDRPASMEIPQDIQELLGPLGEMATNAWRLKVRMIDATTGEPKEETRKLYRFVEGLFRALDEAGIQVIDKTGRPYDSGMPEKVISYEQTPGLAKEEIIDTVRPSVRWKERALFNGEIIVGIPVIEPVADEAPPAQTDSGPVSGDAPAPAPQPSVEGSEPEEESDRCEMQRAEAEQETVPASTGDAQEPPAALDDPEPSEAPESRKEQA